jgi:predicted nucleic acid-binding Zn ribbon protein
MAVHFQCPSCSYDAPVPDEYKGTTLKCPQCAAPAVAGGGANGEGPTRPCPFCSEPIRPGARKCRHCAEILDRGLAIAKQQDRLREIERRQAILLTEVPGARASFICGVMSILSSPVVLPGIILGSVAVLLGASSLKEAPRYPGMEGPRRSRTAITLGIVGIVASLIVLAMLLPSISRKLHSGD